MLADIVGDFGDVGIVQGRVDFVQHEEWRRLEAARALDLPRCKQSIKSTDL